MAKNKYFLFGRNDSNNRFEVIDIEESNVYRDEADYQYDSNSLQDIDLFTINYGSNSDLKRSLNMISDSFFITCKNNDETVYHPVIFHYDEMSNVLRRLALSQDEDCLDSVYVDIILDEFSARLYNDINFYKFIIASYSDLYQQFINHFQTYRNSNNSWSNSAYPIFRQIIESFKNYKQKNDSYNNLENKKVNFLDNKYDTKKDDDIRKKINYIIDFVNNLNYDSIIIDKNVFKINFDYLSCDTDIERQLDSLDVRIKRLLYLISNCKFVSEYEVDKYKDIVNSLNNELMDYLRNDNCLNMMYAFVLLYNKCKREKENIKNGKK